MRSIRNMERGTILTGLAYLVLVLVLGCALLLAGCGSEQKAVEKPARPVRVAVVDVHGEQARTRYSATIEPFEQVALAFKASGYVRDVRKVRGADGRMRNLQEGDPVSAGTVLARIRDIDYVARKDRASASVAEAQAGLEKARLDFDRAERLFQSQSLTKPDFDSARANRDASQARLEAARASLSESESSLSDTILKAPSDGVILKRGIEEGSLVGAGSVGFVVAQTLSVKAIFGVPDSLVKLARMGMILPLRVESISGKEFPGQITSIAPNADPSSRLFEVELSVQNPQGILKPGLIATVEVPEVDPAAARAQAQSLVVPLAAIVRPPGGKFAVFVVEGDAVRAVARVRNIEVGDVYGNTVAVRGGLHRGERVIISGASLLTDGESVQLIP